MSSHRPGGSDRPAHDAHTESTGIPRRAALTGGLLGVAGISSLVLPSSLSHASGPVVEGQGGGTPPPTVSAVAQAPVFVSDDRVLIRWSSGNTSTLTYPRDQTFMDTVSVIGGQHGTSQLGRADETDGYVNSRNDNRHWFDVLPTARAEVGVETPLDPQSSPYLFYTVTAAAGYRLRLAALVLNVRHVFTTTQSTLDVRSSADGYVTSLRRVRPLSSTQQFLAVNLSGHPPIEPQGTVESRLYLHDAETTDQRTINLSGSDQRSLPHDAVLDAPDATIAPVGYSSYGHLSVIGRREAVVG